jgi:hypothetical protein
MSSHDGSRNSTKNSPISPVYETVQACIKNAEAKDKGWEYTDAELASMIDSTGLS